jgi:hypothetical protein
MVAAQTDDRDDRPSRQNREPESRFEDEPLVENQGPIVGPVDAGKLDFIGGVKREPDCTVRGIGDDGFCRGACVARAPRSRSEGVAEEVS